MGTRRACVSVGVGGTCFGFLPSFAMVKSAAAAEGAKAEKHGVHKGEWWKKAATAKRCSDASRLARLEKAKDAHSLHDKQALPEGMQQATLEEGKDAAHMLKTFFSWMSKSACSKSAPSYVNVVKTLYREHNLALESMATPEYLTFVKSSRENCKVGAGLVSVRGSWGCLSALVLHLMLGRAIGFLSQQEMPSQVMRSWTALCLLWSRRACA